MTEQLQAQPEVNRLDDLFTDLARRHRTEVAGRPGVAAEVVDADLAALARDGYVVLPELLSPAEVEEAKAALEELLGPKGRNNFEGHLTQRAYSLLAKTRVTDRMVEHPRVLALADRMLMPNYLLSQLQVIKILPGERGQLLHADDLFYPVPRPRPALSAATMWAIDPFTEDNGATVVLPGSHRWGADREPRDDDPRRPAVMPAGSCVFFLGTLWHGGGANTSGAPRMAVTTQYCEPWLRTQEAFTLSVDRDMARALSPDIRRMIGYSIHPPFVGAVNGLHPERLLAE
ncbi:MAG TPA: phytanoyl-CoA dioxygenase family protein [Pseudonocardia sp.]|jgi:ectoine hydroxylase-related dioxygenase (phytanoyl-CoA dioxygenase family)